MSEITPCFLHIDLDAFFASVEQLDHPEYRGKPVIVGGKPEDKRSVVSTASYEARKYGVHSAMPVYMAYNLCPEGIFVHGRMERYAKISYLIMQIIKNYSPDFIQMSIDEAFIDITGTEKLFGPAKLTAQKIKDEIKEKTGLTVSIGIAPTKYLAKMASEVNKPDGLYCIEKGREQEFMLALPLKKVFGVGEKMLENLKKSGINTTRDIYEKPLDTLVFMFGENSGHFLYNAVRGLHEDNFERKAKSHSISSETTFPEDITNSYAIETTILELCHGIMFRLLRENGYSKTVALKIRYGDFSTVSIQETYSTNILTLDSLYSAAKKLFETKWEKGRGVRLIGVCLENIENEEKPFQQNLFDDGSEKKQKVEKAILNLEKKHPGIKVHKARMLENLSKTTKILLLFVLPLLSLFTVKTWAKENESVQKGAAGILPQTEEYIEEKEDGTKLFNWDIKGYWKANLEDSFTATFGNGNSFSPSFSVPVFTQEIDLSASIQINENWKFLMEFLDDYDKNTFALIYTGDKYLKKFHASNRNIIFPDYYSVKQFDYFPGGGANQAPGIFLHYEDYQNNKFLIDFLLRYDMTTSRSAVYYGKNLVNDTKLEAANFVRTKMFVLPSENALTNIKDIFVETENGTYTDSDGIKYTRLSKSDYLVNTEQKTIIISDSIKTKGQIPEVLVTFTDSSICDSLILEIGQYTNPSTYLGKIQALFSSQDNSLNLSDYSCKLKNEIDGTDAIKLQSSSGFSPFLYSAKYDLGMAQANTVQIISKEAETQYNTYKISIPEKDNTFTQDSVLGQKHYFSDVYNVNLSGPNDYTDPLLRYPFADTNPYIYLTKNTECDIAILCRNYSKISYYDIGKKASSGSVKVFINGIEDKNASYSSTTGFVTPSVNVSDIDKINITWEEESDDFSSGAFTLGAGFVYNFTDTLVFDVSLTGRLPFSPNSSYATKDNNFVSFLSLTSGIKYATGNMKISDALSLALDKENLKDTFILNQINPDKTKVYYLSETSGYKTLSTPSLNVNISSFTPPSLSDENRASTDDIRGQKEENLSGYKIPLIWDFSEIPNGESAWASIDLNLSTQSDLCNSEIFEIALKNESPLLSDDYELYLQLGVKAENTYSGEIRDSIPTWKISDNSVNDPNVLNYFDFSLSDWQFIKIKISEKERSKLISNNDARLIIVKKNYSSLDLSLGTIFAGPYEPHEKNAIIKADPEIFTYSSTSLSNSSPAAKEYFSSDYYADKISWQIDERVTSEDKLFITAEKYFSPYSFSNYNEINYDFAFISDSEKSFTGTDDKGFEFILEEAGETSRTALRLILKKETISQYINDSEQWHSLKIKKDEKSVFLDTRQLDISEYSLYIDSKINPSKQKITINTVTPSSLIKQGTFLSGTIYLTENNTNLLAKNNIIFEYKNTDYVWQVNELSLFKNPELYIQSMQSLSDTDNSINAEVKSSFSSLNVLYSFNSSFLYSSASDNKTILKNAYHSIKTEKPLFDFLTFSELYNYNAENLLESSDSIIFDFNKLNFPLVFSLSARGQETQTEKNQGYNSELKFTIPAASWSIEALTTYNAEYKNVLDHPVNFDETNYFTGSIDIRKTEFSGGSENDLQRKNDFKTSLTLNIPDLNFKPSLTYSSNTIYKNSNTKDFTSSNSFILLLPFTFNSHSINFSYARSAGKTENINLSSYGEDISKAFNHFENNSLVFTAIPFYDLFDSTLPDKLTTPFSSAFYSSKYDVTWKRKLTNSTKDLYLPVTLSLSALRDIRKTQDFNDIYQLKATSIHSFINMFGKEGKLHLFDWFNKDEFTLSLTGSFVLPCGTTEKTNYLFSLYETYLMFINTQNTIKEGFDFTVSDTTWKLRNTYIWSHEGKFSILYYLPKLIFSDLTEEDMKVTRKEIINLSVGKNTSEFTGSYEITHACDCTFKKNYTVTSSLGLVYTHWETKANSIDLKMSLGFKLVF